MSLLAQAPVRLHNLFEVIAHIGRQAPGFDEQIVKPNAENCRRALDKLGAEIADVYKADSIPWCGLFMAVVAKRAGKEVPKHPLWALSWSAFGAKSPAPGERPVMVLWASSRGAGYAAAAA